MLYRPDDRRTSTTDHEAEVLTQDHGGERPGGYCGEATLWHFCDSGAIYTCHNPLRPVVTEALYVGHTSAKVSKSPQNCNRRQRLQASLKVKLKLYHIIGQTLQNKKLSYRRETALQPV